MQHDDDDDAEVDPSPVDEIIASDLADADGVLPPATLSDCIARVTRYLGRRPIPPDVQLDDMVQEAVLRWLERGSRPSVTKRGAPEELYGFARMLYRESWRDFQRCGRTQSEAEFSIEAVASCSADPTRRLNESELKQAVMDLVGRALGVATAQLFVEVWESESTWAEAGQQLDLTSAESERFRKKFRRFVSGAGGLRALVNGCRPLGCAVRGPRQR